MTSLFKRHPMPVFRWRAGNNRELEFANGSVLFCLVTRSHILANSCWNALPSCYDSIGMAAAPGAKVWRRLFSVDRARMRSHTACRSFVLLLHSGCNLPRERSALSVPVSQLDCRKIDDFGAPQRSARGVEAAERNPVPSLLPKLRPLRPMKAARATTIEQAPSEPECYHRIRNLGIWETDRSMNWIVVRWIAI